MENSNDIELKDLNDDKRDKEGKQMFGNTVINTLPWYYSRNGDN